MILEPVISNCDSILSKDGTVLTEPFLSTCDHVLPFIDQLGTGLIIVRADVSGNIERLRTRWKSNSEAYAAVTDIALLEKSKGEHEGSRSCAKGLLWLTRGMRFIVQLLQCTAEDPSMQFSAAVRKAYAAVLQPYHGMISSSAFSIAMAFVPSREAFLDRLGDSEEAVLKQINLFVDRFGGILKILETWLDSNGLNNPEKV
eukprot:jgi/Ulvmu1/3020/UM015_0060.1